MRTVVYWHSNPSRGSGVTVTTRRTLADLFIKQARPIYDWMYRRGAPWEGGPRQELIDLADSKTISPERTGQRVIDLGCGSGSNAIFLAERGFDVIGVDLSPVAIDKARSASAAASASPHWLVGDLRQLPDDLAGPYDLIIDSGTIDDFPRSQRPGIVETVTAFARPGSVLLVWCFYSRDSDLPRLSFSGPSKWGAPSIEPEELESLFDGGWAIEQLSGGTESGFACFHLTRR